ncbi:MAG: aminotransferase class III-fold pyridoxal phosphate-dependent enzyme [Oscillospiraceae bacterium]|jgi:taurine--2-oxoglutarate transaminase|nr:aminotransferase class III-fold pyridoxal phosphate-dependent enzyme [Oscillospiraceae bacterium]
MPLTKDEVLALDTQYNQHPWLPGAAQPLAIARAEGVYFWDYDGKKYIDLSSQLTCNNIGWGNQKVSDAIKAQLDEFAYLAPAHAFAGKSQLAERLVKLANGDNPDAFAKVFFTLGGSDANEAALNMARTVTGRPKILSRYRSYHGSTLGSGNISGDPRRFSLEKPAANGFLKFFDPYLYRAPIAFADDAEASAYYLRQLEEQIIYEGADEIAAVFIEPITGANGVIIPPGGYLQGLRALTQKYGILLVADEVMAGFGRTGKAFAHQHWGIVPDIISFAKGVTSSYAPLGGVIVSREIADYYQDKVFQFGLTYSGHPLGIAAGNACLDFYEETALFDHVQELGTHFAARLDALAAKHAIVGEVRHIGLFGAVELVKDPDTKEPYVPYGGNLGQVFALLRAAGISTYGRENNINVTPPLTITKAELDEALDILDHVLGEINK